MQESAPVYRQSNVLSDTPTAAVLRDAPTQPKLGWQIGGSILSSLIAVLFFPPIFGAIGAILGGYVFAKGQKTMGLALIVAGVAAAIIGMLLAVIALSSTS
jgi:membrane protein DedA with SNARE-associated domain